MRKLAKGFSWGWGALCLGAIAPAVMGLFAQPANATDQIIEVRNGWALLRRNNQFFSASVGTEILSGDLIYPVLATVKVRCQDGGFGESSRVFGLANVCPDSGTRRRYSQAGRGKDDFLAFLAGNFDYASQVLAANPTFRWNPVAGASGYRLQLWACGQAVFNCERVIWTETVEGTAVRYGGAALEAGRNYQLAVTALGGTESSAQPFSQSSTAYLTLRRLDEEQIAQVQAAVAQLDEAAAQAELGAEGKALALARIYGEVAEPNTLPPEGAGLVLDMITALAAVAAESETPYVHQLLGDAYLEVGLIAQARAAYERVLTLSAEGDWRSQRAAAQVGLANVAAVEGDRGRAEVRLQQARVNYVLLGEADRQAQVEQWIERLGF